MTTFQEDAGALAAQADAAGVGGEAALVHVQLAQALLLLLGEGLQQAALLPAAPALIVAPPQDEEEGGAGGHAKQEAEHPPQSQAGALPAEEAVVVQPTQEVAEALLGRLQLDQVVVEDQLAHARHAGAHAQHLLRLVDAFGLFPAQEVSDDAGQGLGRGVEVLVGGLQIQVRGLQRTNDADGGCDIAIVRRQGERDRVGALVDDFLCAVPANTRFPS